VKFFAPTNQILEVENFVDIDLSKVNWTDYSIVLEKSTGKILIPKKRVSDMEINVPLRYS